MMRRLQLALALIGAGLGGWQPVAAQSCTGDCDANGTVTVDEVVTGVSIALGSRSINDCLPFDSSGDNSVTVDEILQASNFALDGCPAGTTPTPGPAGTATATHTATRSPTPTFPSEPGPLITYFGLAGASNRVLTPTGTDAQNRPIYQPTCRNGFFIVVEGRPNPNNGNIEVGRQTFNSDPANPSVRPDFQLLANRNLGNGSGLICDHRGGLGAQPPFGGIPGFDPPDFNPSSQPVADALNDLGCRFNARTTQDPCTASAFGNPRFVDAASTIQFCNELTVDGFWALPLGDTVFVVQLRDAFGSLGQRREIVVRPLNDCPPGL